MWGPYSGFVRGSRIPVLGPREGLSYGAERELLLSAKESQSPGPKGSCFPAWPGEEALGGGRAAPLQVGGPWKAGSKD